MKKLLFCYLLVAAYFVMASHAFAQNKAEPPALVYAENSSQLLHGDRVNVRDAANSKAKVIDNLAIGTAIKIVKQDEKLFTQNELTNYWYKVSYTKDGKTKEGYIWGGLIAVASRVEGLYIISVGYNLTHKKGDKYGQVRLIKDGKELSFTNFESPMPWLTRPPEIEISALKGFDGVDKLITVVYNEPYCGGSNNQELIFWLPAKLMHVHSTSEGADAPVYATEEVIFPDEEGGKANRLHIKQQSGEMTDEGNEIITSESDFWLIWNGVSLKRPNKN
jgi:hypothetical protein